MYVILYITITNGRQHFHVVCTLDEVKMLLKRIEQCTDHKIPIYGSILVYKLGEQINIEQKEQEMF
jgi:hypothetical protein